MITIAMRIVLSKLNSIINVYIKIERLYRINTPYMMSDDKYDILFLNQIPNPLSTIKRPIKTNK